MSKMIDIEALKPLLKDFIPDDDTTVIEGIMAASVDTDDAAVQSKIDEAVESAKKESASNYVKQLHDMFFNGIKPDVEENTTTGKPLNGAAVQKTAPNIFVSEDA